MIKIPPYLKKGDTIGIVCPSGFMPYDKAETCIKTLKGWGFKVVTGKTLGNQFHYFSGTDEERLNDLQAMLDNPDVHAILCGRGGYGLSRIIDKIDFKAFKKNPKWTIGYSDITLLHAHIYSNLKIATLHAPMAAAFNNRGAENKYVQSLLNVLKGKASNYTCDVHPLNRRGEAVGVLVGGNLSMLVHGIGGRSAINTKNTILFIEDIGEYLYHIDRMMIQLKRAGMLENLAGLIIGSFTDMKDTTIPFGKDVYSIIQYHIFEYDYPVCFNFPVGHTSENFTFKIGAKFSLKVNGSKSVLKEL